mgnify:CR=1 FL=1
MDAYIDSDALDLSNRFASIKLENLARADACSSNGVVEVDALPCKLTLQTTDVCNLSCPHCQIPRQHKKHHMSAAWLEILADTLFPFLIELHPTNLGEPFAWPHFHRLCCLMDEFGVVLDLTTNGTYLSRERVEWISPIAREIKISFDGATAPTFERFRLGASFEDVCGNVRGLVDRLRKVATRNALVTLQMTLMKDNFRELPRLIHLAHELGANRVKAYHMFSFNPETREQSLMHDLSEYEQDVLPRALEAGLETGIDLQLAEPSGGRLNDLRHQRCFLPWHESWVDIDGSVLVCHSHGGVVAGSLNHFDSAWNGPVYKEIRAGLAGGVPRGMCKGCGMNLVKTFEHEQIPFDPPSFLGLTEENVVVRWSGRMRPFDLRGRREWNAEPEASSNREPA